MLAIRQPVGVRGHHCLEFPVGAGDAQGQSGPGRGLHGRAQAVRADAIHAGAGLAGRAGRHAARRTQRGHRRPRTHRRGTDPQPHGAQADLHRVDADRTPADAAERIQHQEAVAGAGRQRALHRIRGRRPGRGRARPDAVQVPQCRPDLRVRQPRLRSCPCGRCLQQQAAGGNPPHEGRPGGGRHSRAADRPARRGQGDAPGGRRHRARRTAAAARAPGTLLYEPTLLTGITDAMALAHEEIFGPVVAISTFESEAAVLARANASASGLARTSTPPTKNGSGA